MIYSFQHLAWYSFIRFSRSCVQNNTVTARGISLRRNYPFVSKISSSRISLCLFFEGLLYVDPSQFDDYHSYTSNSVERKKGNVNFRATRLRTRHVSDRIFVAISLASSQFRDFPTLWNGQLKRSSPWNRVRWTFRSNDFCRDHVSISFRAKSRAVVWLNDYSKKFLILHT